MSGRIQSFARRMWAGEAGLVGRAWSLAMAPMAAGFSVAVGARNRRHDRHPAVRVENIRVISVGNLAVGGTGKTPLSAWVVRCLASEGEAPALVTRGYGRDELLLHARWNPEIPVFADADRVAATQKAAGVGATVAVLDDGFQHRRLGRDLDLVLLATEDSFPGHMLPWGPYREPAAALARADAVIVTRRTADAADAEALAKRVASDHPHLVMARVHLAPGGWEDLTGEPTDPPTGPVVVATAIARPEAFATHVESALGTPVELVSYTDHHDFTPKDVRALAQRAGRRQVVVTEKDAVKLMAFSAQLPDARVLSQDVRWEGGEDLVRRLILDGEGGPPS